MKTGVFHCAGTCPAQTNGHINIFLYCFAPLEQGVHLAQIRNELFIHPLCIILYSNQIDNFFHFFSIFDSVRFHTATHIHTKGSE